MRWIAALAGMLLALGCSKKDEGPFAEHLARLPVEADLVVLLDAGATSRTLLAWLDELERLPLLQASPDIRDILKGQRTALDQLLVPVRDKLGLDPFKDLSHAALALVLAPAGEPQVVLVARGAFPPDLLRRAFPEAAIEERQGLQVARLPAGVEAMLLDGCLVLAHPGLASGASTLDPKRAQALKERHPALGAPLGQDFLLRASFLVPAWLSARLGEAGSAPGLGLVQGLDRVEIELDRALALRLAARDPRTAESWRYMLTATADAIAGSQHMLRAVAHMALSLDLDRLPDVPAPVRLLLKDEEALAGALEALLPAPAQPPQVRQTGLQAEIVLERKSLLALGLLGSAALGAAMPLMLLGGLDGLDATALEELDEPPGDDEAAGGAP
jgi:hypothetical protein